MPRPRRLTRNISKVSCDSNFSRGPVATSSPAPPPVCDQQVTLEEFLQKFDILKDFEEHARRRIEALNEKCKNSVAILCEVFPTNTSDVLGNTAGIFCNLSSEELPSSTVIEQENDPPEVNKIAASTLAVVSQPSLEKRSDDNIFKQPLPVTFSKTTPNHTKTPLPSGFQTPANRMLSSYSIAQVTPGPSSQRPLSIMRKPKQGEVAISLSGSPLIVATDNDFTGLPQINVPLEDGRVVSILPREGFDPSHLPTINEQTKQQLSQLRAYLDRVCTE